MSKTCSLIALAILALVVHGAPPSKRIDAGAGYRAALDAKDYSAAIKSALADCSTDRASASIEALGALLAVDDVHAAALLDELEKDNSLPALTLRGELLLRIAQGNDIPAFARKGQATKPSEMETSKLAARAAVLLEHTDPFVRTLGEWTLAVRLGVECEGRRVKPWPDPVKNPWYARWLAIDPQAQLDFDYARQAIASGSHRSTEALVLAGESVVRRAREMVSYHLPHLSSAQQTSIRAALAKVEQSHDDLRGKGELADARVAFIALRRAARDVVLATPDLPDAPILFATRTGPDSGNITNGSIRDLYGPVGDIFVKPGYQPSDPARPLIRERLGPGHLRGMDLHWDAKRLVFSFVKQPNSDLDADANAENTEKGRAQTAHLYEMNSDGSALRQLTNLPYNSDIEPCYLANDDIVFVSDRSNYGSQCAGDACQDKMITNLFRCAPDGSNVRWLSNNKDFDRYPHMLENGQLLFLHWEYQERHLWQTHTLWTCRPDGSMTDAIYKQHIESGPMSLREARQIPGRQMLVAIACGHHNGEIGSLFLVDYSKGINDPQAMHTVTPLAATSEGGYGGAATVQEGGVQEPGGHYAFPYPLSDKSFLVAFSYRRPTQSSGHNYGLYYVDVWGNKELIHRDPRISVTYLMPLRPTVRPPVLRDRPASPSKVEERFATVIMTNADYGITGENVRPVKYLRLAQKMPWPCVRTPAKPSGYNDLHATPSGAWTPFFGVWDWGPARAIGIVPVESDGSAHFKAPIDQPIYFSALDENFLEVRRMRSNVTFQAGETRSCIGCHETKATTSSRLNGTPLALQREPSMPQPPLWGAAQIPDYERDIQPIIARRCESCHGEKDPAEKLEFSSRRVGDYLQSYRTLFGIAANQPMPIVSEDAWKWLHPKETAPPIDKEFYKAAAQNRLPGQLVQISDRFGGAGVTQAMAFGSARSKFLTSLKDHPGHKDALKITREEFVALATWVDLNAPYFGAYIDKDSKPARWVTVEFPDPWVKPPAGEWVWKDRQTVILRPD